MKDKFGLRGRGRYPQYAMASVCYGTSARIVQYLRILTLRNSLDSFDFQVSTSARQKRGGHPSPHLIRITRLKV